MTYPITIHKKVPIILYHADIYFFSIRQHKTQILLVLLTKHGQGNGGVLENTKIENQNKPKNLKMTPQFELWREDFNA